MFLAILGTAEIVILLVVVLLLFGPAKLPQLGAGIGKMLRGFKKEMRALEDDKNEGDEGTREEIDVTPKDSAGKASGVSNSGSPGR